MELAREETKRISVLSIIEATAEGMDRAAPDDGRHDLEDLPFEKKNTEDSMLYTGRLNEDDGDWDCVAISKYGYECECDMREESSSGGHGWESEQCECAERDTHQASHTTTINGSVHFRLRQQLEGVLTPDSEVPTSNASYNHSQKPAKEIGNLVLEYSSPGVGVKALQQNINPHARFSPPHHSTFLPSFASGRQLG